jgi:hypothetical protein
VRRPVELVFDTSTPLPMRLLLSAESKAGRGRRRKRWGPGIFSAYRNLQRGAARADRMVRDASLRDAPDQEVGGRLACGSGSSAQTVLARPLRARPRPFYPSRSRSKAVGWVMHCLSTSIFSRSKRSGRNRPQAGLGALKLTSAREILQRPYLRSTTIVV